jgi:hypothetical protein
MLVWGPCCRGRCWRWRGLVFRGGVPCARRAHSPRIPAAARPPSGVNQGRPLRGHRLFSLCAFIPLFCTCGRALREGWNNENVRITRTELARWQAKHLPLILPFCHSHLPHFPIHHRAWRRSTHPQMAKYFSSLNHH